MISRLYPKALQNIVEELGHLPGIGRKTASRLAFHILSIPENEAYALADAILNLKKAIHLCPICFHLAEDTLCSICSDSNRQKSQICVVEDAVGIFMIEKTNEYYGLYHVLGGVISPLDGIGVEDLHVKELINRFNGIEEIIFALNPTTEGEATSIYLSRLIKPFNIKITRLARGIPLGSNLEFIDELTLSKALKSRIEI